MGHDYIEQYQARDGGVTLHTWTDMQGAKKENFYITGMPGAPVPACRSVPLVSYPQNPQKIC